ncbi:Golgi-associated PDZ and coiled-coil motif-containing protein-like [Rhodnius prolixus]|uniref:Golgi-associated PDZ and coiled-coil motif-containing protein-like n=1 Tax=Rhodnius prolixus TaxID=13249 RepID=UPI003D18EE90
MAVTAMSFRWLDLLEKEFDKAYVDLDILIGELDSDEPEMVYAARQKMSTLSSCFAQLTHKAQTIFQNNAKVEAELVDMRSCLVDLETRNDELTEELHKVLVQVHKSQLQQKNKEEGTNIATSLNKALAERSPTHRAAHSGVNIDKLIRHLENWKKRLEIENESLRATIATLQAEVCGARLSARYLDKELAGRIQQLQLVGRTDMVAAVRDRLWAQLEAEILVQRQKTVVRAVRQNDARTPCVDIFNTPRTVVLKRDNDSIGLGISITGGREHGVPILISELEPGGGTEQLYVGDAILSVNGIDLTQVSHNDAVKILSNQVGEVKLKVKYVGQDETEDDSDLTQLRYGFFNDGSRVVNSYQNGYNKELTPTAPRTPESSVRDASESSYTSSPHMSENQEESIEKKSTNIDNSSPVKKQEPISPLHIGVTTLQKIFRTLTPSGVWKEQESEVDGKTSNDQSKNNINIPNSQSQHYFLNKSESQRNDKQKIYYSDTVANSYVDGFGDASFGTPV